MGKNSNKGIGTVLIFTRKKWYSPYFFIFTLLVILLPCAITFAGDEVFVGPTNWGGTGLMETPTARVMKEGRFRFGVSQIDPYRYYYGAVSPLQGLEIGGRVTEILDVPTLTASYGNYKDKAIDLKYQFHPEGKWWPAISLGMMDPIGTRIYPSQYIVASKQFYPFDFSIGFGNGRFGKAPFPLQETTSGPKCSPIIPNGGPMGNSSAGFNSRHSTGCP